MPLTKIQTDILSLLASHRDAESYVAGASPLNVRARRYSRDIDIFHDREERVSQAAEIDAQTLRSAGYEIRWIRQQPMIQTAEVDREGLRTVLEWVMDSDYRFFPAVPDATFGFALHPVDLAMNKAMAAAGRRALRDLVDLVTIHETVLPLGAVIWAAVEKAPGFTPEGLINQIRRNSNFPRMEWAALQTDAPLDPIVVSKKLRDIIEEAEAFVARMPTAKAGLLFLEDGKVVQPDPAHLERYQTHAGQRRGHWPGSPEIATAMLEHYTSAPAKPKAAGDK